VEFASVVDAVRCALEVQEHMGERNAHGSSDTVIAFRIGINLGDVIIDQEDTYGDGVNIAARLETIAPVGGICISGAAYEQVEGKVNVIATDIGEQRLKNIVRPVRAYTIYPVGVLEPTRSASTSEIPAAPRLSLVVLPFVNRSGSVEQDYLPPRRGRLQEGYPVGAGLLQVRNQFGQALNIGLDLVQCENPSAAHSCYRSIEESAFTGTRGDADETACNGHHDDTERCARAADARETARKAHAL
jgi:hypothetical protein